MIRPTRELAPSIQAIHDVDLYYFSVCAQPSDINAHLPVLRAAAYRCRFDDGGIVEFGVRGIVSTWAFLSARPVNGLVSVDIADPQADLLETATGCAIDAGVPFRFVRMDTLVLPPVKCAMLFIDTLHTATQLTLELRRHAAGVSRYIAFHDTVTFGWEGEDGACPGLQDVVERLCAGTLGADVGKWRVVWHDEACNGMTIIERLR